MLTDERRIGFGASPVVSCPPLPLFFFFVLFLLDQNKPKKTLSLDSMSRLICVQLVE